MTDMGPKQEERLLAELGRVLDTVDPGGAISAEVARESFAWRNIDAELAELVFDSSVDKSEVLVRSSGDDTSRSLSFIVGVTGVEIEIQGDRLIGQVIPGQRAKIELLRPTSDISDAGETDELGVFTLNGLGRGAFSLRFTGPEDDWSIRTSWIVL